MGLGGLFGVVIGAAAPARAQTTIVVTSASDVAADDGLCTLREALVAANTDAASGALAGECAAGQATGTDRIHFAIGAGAQTITPGTALPPVTDSTVVDGTTQPGWSAAAPALVLSGAACTPCAGLTVSGGTVVVSGLRIEGFAGSGGAGIQIDGGAEHVVSGSVLIGNGIGVAIGGTASMVVVGGAAAGVGNVISGNLVGVLIDGGSFHDIVGNRIGTDAAGTAALPNLEAGVYIGGTASGVLVGGDRGAGEGNVLSGNGGPGVRIDAGEDHLVAGNLIGTDASGAAALSNAGHGVQVSRLAAYVQVGAPEGLPGGGNVISGNGGDGVHIDGGMGHRIAGNRIGTNAAGTAALANAGVGVALTLAAEGVLVGGDTPEARNVISGNALEGARIDGGSSHTIVGNHIGTDAAGTAALANGGAGVSIFDGAVAAWVGGVSEGEGNVISGNPNEGIWIDGGFGHVVAGNAIGLGTGAAALPNGGHGVRVTGTAEQVAIVGYDAETGNTISGNGGDGVRIEVGVTQVNVLGNAVSGNDGDGVHVEDGVETVGVFGNEISANAGTGVRIAGGAAQVTVQGNAISANVALGLDVGPEGVTSNDVDGAVPGGVQNFPVLTDAAGREASGTLASAPGAEFAIEVFASTAQDPSGHGEGQLSIGLGTATTDATGEAPFAIDLDRLLLPGEHLTATATDSLGNTSEFSLAWTVPPAPISTATVATSPGWRLVAPPVYGMTVGTLAGLNLVQGVAGEYPAATPNLFTAYTGSAFVPAAATTDTLTVGAGVLWYFFASGGPAPADPDGTSLRAPLPTTLTATGPGATGPVDVVVTGAERTGVPDGFYLLGNPYGAPFDLSGLRIDAASAAAPATLSDVFHLYDPDTGWRTVTRDPCDCVETDDVAPWQGFFAEVTATGEPKSDGEPYNPGAAPLTFTYDPAFLAGSEPVFVGKNAPPPLSMLSLSLRGTVGGRAVVDRAASVLVHETARESWDSYDASKRAPLSSPSVTVALGGRRGDAPAWQAQRSLPRAQTAPIDVPLFLSASAYPAALTLAFERSETFTWQALLVDLRTGEEQAMPGAGALSVSLSASDTTRYALRLLPGTATGAAPPAAAPETTLRAWPNPVGRRGQIGFTVAATAPARVEAFDVLGRRVAVLFEGTAVAGTPYVQALDGGALPPGLYVLRLSTGGTARTLTVTVAR